MKKLLGGFAKLIEACLVLLMTLMVIVVFSATVGRYSGLFAIPWSEEFARYCMVTIVYCGLMLASLEDRHFVVELVPLLFRQKTAVLKFCNVLVSVLLDLFAVFVVYYGNTIISKMLTQGKLSPMLSVPLGCVYLVIPSGIAFMALFYTFRTFEKLRETDDGTPNIPIPPVNSGGGKERL